MNDEDLDKHTFYDSILTPESRDSLAQQHNMNLEQTVAFVETEWDKVNKVIGRCLSTLSKFKDDDLMKDMGDEAKRRGLSYESHQALSDFSRVSHPRGPSYLLFCLEDCWFQSVYAELLHISETPDIFQILDHKKLCLEPERLRYRNPNRTLQPL